MSALFTDTATVYNCYKDSTGKEHWNRSVIKGVQWKHGKRQVSVANGIATEMIVESLTFDFQRNYKGNKPYIKASEYKKLSLEEAKEYWTLNETDLMDYLVYGESDKEMKKPRDLEQKYTVTSVGDNRNRPRLKHIKVVAK